MNPISRRRFIIGSGALGLAGAQEGCKDASAENAWRQLRVGDKIDINGIRYEAECGTNPFAIRAYNSKYVHFTMIPGNGWKEDDPDNTERAELDGWKHRFGPRVERWAAYSIYYEPGPWSTTDWCILRQIYPWSGLVLKPGGILHWAGDATTDLTGMFGTRFATKLNQGTWYHIVERVVIDPDGIDGHWQSWLNGVQVLDSTLPFGMRGRKDYWFKFGIYRGKWRNDGRKVDEIVSVRYANVRFGADDLSALIAKPDPVELL